MTNTWTLVLAAVVLCSVPGGVFLKKHAAVQCETYDGGYYTCIHKNLTSIPEDIPGSVRVLHLDTNNLTALRNKELLNKGCMYIERLYISRNSIAELEDEAFSGLANLNVVNLYSNNLTVFSKDIFSGNLKLKRFTLGANPIKLPDSETAPLLTSASLISLSLSGCGLTRITEGLFSDLPNLRILMLTENRLTTLNWFSLNHLTKLTQLDFSGNAIRHLTCEPEIVLPLTELNDLEPGPGTLETSLNDPYRTLSLANNPLECDCCFNLTCYALRRLSWRVFGECQGGEGSCSDPVPAERLKQCYLTFMEGYNTTAGEV